MNTSIRWIRTHNVEVCSTVFYWYVVRYLKYKNRLLPQTKSHLFHDLMTSFMCKNTMIMMMMLLVMMMMMMMMMEIII